MAANRAVRAIVALPRPVVAVVQGPAAGVGVSLALACDLVLASDKAFFMLAFTKIGLMPDGGASALIAAAIGRIGAMRMALLAERLPAADALACGLISAVYPADDFDAEVDKVVSGLLSGPAVAFAKTKDAINAATLTELEPRFSGNWRVSPCCCNHTTSARRKGFPAASDTELHRQLTTSQPEQRGQRQQHDQAPDEVGQDRRQHPAGGAALNAHTVPRMIAAKPSMGFRCWPTWRSRTPRSR